MRPISYKDTSQVGLGPTLMAHLNLITSLNLYLQIQSHSDWELELQPMNFGEDTIRSITGPHFSPVCLRLPTKELALISE